MMNRKLFATCLGAVIVTSMLNLGAAHEIHYNRNTILVGSLPDDISTFHALIVGISDYNGSEVDLPASGPRAQAERFSETLCNHGWSENNIHLLVDDEATRDNILAELDWLSEQDGTVLFFFEGHGTIVKDLDDDEKGLDNKDEAIVPWEATDNSLIIDDELKVIVDSFKAEKIVLIFSSCFSGGMNDDTDDEDHNDQKTLSLLKLSERFPISKTLRYFLIFMNILHKNPIVSTLASSNDKEFEELKIPMEELQANNRIIITASQEYLTAASVSFFGEPMAMWMTVALDGGKDKNSSDFNRDNFISAEEAFRFTRPRAVLEMLIAEGAPVVMITIAKEWVRGEITTAQAILFLLYMGAAYSISTPIPQMYDGNIDEDTILTYVG